MQAFNFYRMPTDANARRLFLGTLMPSIGSTGLMTKHN